MWRFEPRLTPQCILRRLGRRLNWWAQGNDFGFLTAAKHYRRPRFLLFRRQNDTGSLSSSIGRKSWQRLLNVAASLPCFCKAIIGLPTAILSPAIFGTNGNERWLGVFLRFDRLLSDERTDGNSQRVFFRRDESFAIIVRQAPEAAEGSASRVSLVEDELLVCDVRRRAGQTQIAAVDIDTARRQSFLRGRDTEL